MNRFKGSKPTRNGMTDANGPQRCYRTLYRAAPSMPIAFEAARLRSMQGPLMNGPAVANADRTDLGQQLALLRGV